jgi:hypothetical protein
LVNAELLKHFKKGSWLVNTARGAICDKDAVAEALKSGHLNGYSGDVWNVQPAPKDHVWRTMKNPLGAGNGMVPHYSGTTLDAQKRYADGAKSILENYLAGKEQHPANIIVGKGKYQSKACECPDVSNFIAPHIAYRRPALNWCTAHVEYATSGMALERVFGLKISSQVPIMYARYQQMYEVVFSEDMKQVAMR